jgi:hypothetical protein
MGFLCLYRYYRFLGMPLVQSIRLARHHRMHVS